MLQTIGIIVGVISGLAGLGLGILNYIEQRYRTRPRIRVRPRVRSIVDRDKKTTEENVGLMEVSNIGQVPVIGSTIGFLKKKKGDKDLLVISPDSINGKPWSGELQPGHVTMLRMDLNTLPAPEELGRAFAATLIGDVFRCSRKDMRVFCDELNHVRKGKTTPPTAT